MVCFSAGQNDWDVAVFSDYFTLTWDPLPPPTTWKLQLLLRNRTALVTQTLWPGQGGAGTPYTALVSYTRNVSGRIPMDEIDAWMARAECLMSHGRLKGARLLSVLGVLLIEHIPIMFGVCFSRGMQLLPKGYVCDRNVLTEMIVVMNAQSLLLLHSNDPWTHFWESCSCFCLCSPSWTNINSIPGGWILGTSLFATKVCASGDHAL